VTQRTTNLARLTGARNASLLTIVCEGQANLAQHGWFDLLSVDTSPEFLGGGPAAAFCLEHRGRNRWELLIDSTGNHVEAAAGEEHQATDPDTVSVVDTRQVVQIRTRLPVDGNRVLARQNCER